VKDPDSEKCLEMETQLQEALKELSYAQLITELLRNDYKLSLSIEDVSINPAILQARFLRGRLLLEIDYFWMY
jgi:hypothetical protein